MAQIIIRLDGRGDCTIGHEATGTSVRSSKSPAFGGTGRSFSSTDLLAAALGSCIATDIEPVAERHGIALEAIRIGVDKELTVQPKKIHSLHVHVQVPSDVDDLTITKLERAASHCLVHRSLHPDIEVALSVGRAEPPGTVGPA